MAINISFGNTYGSHSGTSLIETYLNNVSNLGRTAICVGTGNEGAAAGHTQGVLTEGNPRDIEFSISNNETAMNLQIWKSYVDEVNIAIVHPSGMEAGPIQPFLGPTSAYCKSSKGWQTRQSKSFAVGANALVLR